MAGNYIAMLKPRSLSVRLLLSSGIVLAAFFAIAALVLEKGFRESAEQGLKEKLQVQIYALLSAAELPETGPLKMPANLHEPRLTHPGSGLFAFIQHPDGQVVWRSPSAVGVDALRLPDLSPGSSLFTRDDSGHFVLYYNVIWEKEAGQEQEYFFSVAEDARFLSNQVARFKNTLRIWLLAIGLLLVLLQFIVLRWNLKPLRIIGRDLAAIERGEKTRLEGVYPTELQGLAGNLNTLITSERAHLERYRNTLADLAHSIKTPLAIIRGCLELQALPEEIKKNLQGQIARMDDIVAYQLQRASTKRYTSLVGRVDAGAIITRTAESLKKVYTDKQLELSISIHGDSRVYYGEGDLYEIIGNLMDNACKWCRKQVSVTLVMDEGKSHSLTLLVEDDGPGIPPQKLKEILRRGVRADENIAGHGIGMAIVNELLDFLGGDLLGGRSERLGGMKWTVTLP